MFKRLFAVMLLALVPIPSAVLSQGTGQVVDVRPQAQVVSGGSSRALAQGSQVSGGDVIRTGASGQVQILFPDETKIVVGPNSSLKIDQSLFRTTGTARKFATSALGGSFRFISGKSPKNVYKLATPVATMGIRGTAFDYTVNRGQSTDLLVFEGLVRFCAAGGRCVNVPGGCQAVTVMQGGEFTQPQNDREKQELLALRFPLLADQDDLQPPFRAATDGCNVALLINLPRSNDERDRDRNRGGGNPAEGPSDPQGGGENPAE